MQYDKKDFNDQRIDNNSPIGWIITMVVMAGISVGWYFVFPHFWPENFQKWIAWVIFAIPVSITVLLPLMYVIRRTQRRKGTGPFKEN